MAKQKVRATRHNGRKGENGVFKAGHNDRSFDVDVAELVEEFTKRFGSHVQVLDWALHMDETTPHIHERHVFFADDGYGMYFPKQERACEALGFERPNLEKKSNKFNNAKMVFDEEVRKLYIEIAEKYGVLIEKIPLEGKKHLEKNDYILAKQAEEIANNEARLQSLELKIEDVETFSEEIAKVAYEKALGDPASKKKNTDEIADSAKASVLAKLKEQKEQVALADQQRGQTPPKKKEECL